MPTEWRRWLRGLALGCAALPAAGLAQEFDVTLDGRPIGTHRFTVGGSAQARTVRSEASFTVKLLGLTVYRYRHLAQETWRGDCLAGLDAQTDDDGQASRVQATAAPQGLLVDGPAGTQTLPGCVMSYAYWNPAMRGRDQLLNVQTGRYDAVRIRRIGTATVDVRGQVQTAERWRIEGAEQPLDLWVTPGGEWVGLDSTVGGGRQLRYRLR